MTHVSIAIDSEFQSLIPPLSDSERQRLEKSILAEGVREPIVTWNGTIIDGHNRYHICEEHGIGFKTAEREFASRDAAKIWIIENQFGRRNLSTYDSSVLALQLESLYAAEAKKRMIAGKADPVKNSAQGSDTGRTIDKLAKLAGTSRDTIRKVKVIETEAAKGNQTAIEARNAVKSGEKSIYGAYTEIRPRICTVCGKPIEDGDHYPRDRNKHKACATKLENENKRRARRKAKLAEDGRRICSICGEPINDGEHYQDKLNWHYQCGLEHEIETHRKYMDADYDLRNNVAVYTVESLRAELLASAESMEAALRESIAINESMGVKLAKGQKKRLDEAVTNLYSTIRKIEGEVDNG